MLNMIVIILTTIVFVRVFFNFALTLNGGWDDINFVSIFMMPGVAVVALILSLLNSLHFRGHGGYVLASVGVLAFAVALMIYVALTVAFRTII